MLSLVTFTLSAPAAEKVSSLEPAGKTHVVKPGNHNLSLKDIAAAKEWQDAKPQGISFRETICAHGLCGGTANDLAAFDPCAYPSNTCRSWCAAHQCTWQEKCTWDNYCAGCGECAQADSCQPFCWALTDPSFSAAWKKGTKKWDEVCNLGSCHGCSADSACGGVQCGAAAPAVKCEDMRGYALNFEGASIKFNNLGGVGPTLTDPPELRLTGLTKNGKSFDVVIHNLTQYNPPTEFTQKLGTNGMSGNYGQIGLSHGLTEFKVKFVETGTYNPVTVDNSMDDLQKQFALTFFDFDMGSKKVLAGGVGKKCAEVLKITKPSYEQVYTTTNNNVKIEESGDTVTATALITMAGGDNVHEWELTQEQKDKAFAWSTMTPDMTLTLGYVDGAGDPTYCEPATKGRWWQFSGYSPAFPCID